MAQMIPLFLAKEENSSSMARQRVFGDLNDPLDCYDDLELVRRFRFSRVSISQITELMANYLNFTKRSYAASPHLQVCGTSIFRFWNVPDNLWRWDKRYPSFCLSLYPRCFSVFASYIVYTISLLVCLLVSRG